MEKWNPKTGHYEKFIPGDRTYPSLSAELANQVAKIPTTSCFCLTYCPCRATLRNGGSLDCVYLVEAKLYLRVWGAWPDQDRAKQEIAIDNVVRIEESPSRLPATFAQKLYDAGESGMGYVFYEIEYRDGTRSAHVSGNAVDFVTLPSGRIMSDIVAIHPHEGRHNSPVGNPGYYWCLYSAYPKTDGWNTLASLFRLVKKVLK